MESERTAKLTRFWHSRVHERFGEQLMFCLLSIRASARHKFESQFVRFAKQKGFSSYQVYQVFGTSDFLLRIWIHPGDQEQILSTMIQTIDELESVQPFKVSTTILDYSKSIEVVEPDERSLDSLTVEKVQAIQRDETPSQPIEPGLLTQYRGGPERIQKTWIRFAIAVQLPLRGVPQSTDVQIGILKRAVLEMAQGDGPLDNASMHLGFGFASVLVIADIESQNYYRISALIDNMIEKLGGVAIATSTYLVGTPDALICDDIGTATLSRLRNINPAVKSLFPELYDDGVHPKLQRNIEGWIWQNIVEPSVMSSADFEEFLRGPLVGVARSDSDVVTAQFFLVIQRIERYLRDHRTEFIRRAISADAIGRITQAVVKNHPDLKADNQGSPQKDTRFKHLTLGVLLDIYGKAIAEISNDSETLQLAGGWEVFANLRNDLAHGELEPLPEWQRPFEVFLDFLKRFNRLKAIVTGVLSSPNVSTPSTHEPPIVANRTSNG